jgi:parallel beta-helix repeat protein
MRRLLAWIARIAAGLIALVIIATLALGLWPVGPDRAPRQLESRIGPPDGASTTAPVSEGAARTLRVAAGESIQAAIDQARPGDVVEVQPGTYHEALRVSIDNLTLRGVAGADGSWPVLDGQDRFDDGVLALKSFFTIERFQLRNYLLNGVVAAGGHGITFRDLIIADTGEYGVYPVACAQVLVERVTVSGATDAGLYIGQSRDIVVRDNEVFANVSGIEIENSLNALVENNTVHDNTAGILVFLLPGLEAKEGGHARVLRNRIENNNTPNFATHGIVSRVPPGVGVIVLIADDTEVAHNTVRGNHSGGIGVVGAGIFFTDTAQFDIPLVPERTWLHDNTFADNGGQPAEFLREAGLPGVDVLWDASAWDNRFDDAGARTFPILPSSSWPDLTRRAWWRALQLLQQLVG